MNRLRKLSTVEELANYLQVRARWVYEHCRNESPDPIPHIKLGKYLRFDLESQDFHSWLERQWVIGGVDNNEAAL